MRFLGFIFLLVIPLACAEGKIERTAQSEEQLRQDLEHYLPLLAQAYSTGELQPLEGLAAEKEIAYVRKYLEKLKDSGRILEPRFEHLTIEDFNIWNNSNAFVTTVEVWDVKLFATGSHTLLGEDLGRSDRVKYQLKRDGGRWRVLYRSKQG
jgi:hypothetical protein